ncbi:MAG: alanine--tRNA ligase [Candidatus Omnitrophica bacterium]|nr:alanine--tRNA ligase [Candidatus Omnitrophota bacterium]
MKTDDIRRAYLEFFRSKGHEVVASDSLVPKDDPTLLFTGAGMNQFKERFLGRNVTYKRAASSQKCLRTGDLENVGRTAGHHTFFEMLGNFSFGDYFKKEAIGWAWEFLTQSLKLKPQNLWASVYQDDEEAFGIWKDVIKLPAYKIIRFGAKENFWPSEAPAKGPNGPCGPCSEIFYDWGEKFGCGKPGCTPACECGRFSEVWNLVFTQFDRQPDGALKPLPSKNIDTGMGLERIAAVMQGVRTNFEIDIFRPVVEEIKKASKSRRINMSRVNAIADHIRAVTFTICDGVMPSNEERGYVIRKLIRRCAIYARELDIKPPFAYKLVSAVVEAMKPQYPALVERRDDIAQVVKREEESFLFVLQTQIPKVEEAFKELAHAKGGADLAAAAFDFYDTYGMPYEMLEEMAEKYGLKIDRTAFETLLEKQRELSRAKTKIKSEIFTETFAKKVEALGLKTEFLGYENSHAEAKVVAVLGAGEVILDRTPFYGESGGQVGDWGEIETASGRMEVEDAKRIGDTIVHIGRMERGAIKTGEKAKVRIDDTVRKKIMRNHTATHLLQAALRKVLGDHVHQTGSLVDQDHLRFDFTHMKKMDEREIGRVEELVNDAIKKAIPVTKEIKSIKEAQAEGATALFGEKYGDTVRVVSVSGVSNELCGGTHVDNTGEIGLFKIIRESSTASGVRRIEAVTGAAAEEWMEKQEERAAAQEKSEAAKEEAKKAMALRLKEELAKVDSFVANARAAGSARVVVEKIDGVTMDVLRTLSDAIKAKAGGARTAVVLATDDGAKVSFIVALTEDLSKGKIGANEIAKALAAQVSGSGGGRPDFAQGGGKEPAKLESALKSVLNTLKEKLS